MLTHSNLLLYDFELLSDADGRTGTNCNFLPLHPSASCELCRTHCSGPRGRELSALLCRQGTVKSRRGLTGAGTCKIHKRSGIQDPQDPTSRILEDLGSYISTLPRYSRDFGPRLDKIAAGSWILEDLLLAFSREILWYLGGFSCGILKILYLNVLLCPAILRILSS